MSKPRAFFLTPEPPVLSAGGGGMRATSVLTYLQNKYDTTIFTFELPIHRATTTARVLRNAWRILKRRPPLFDRFSGFEKQLREKIEGHYQVAVIEHFWCASYASVLRPHTDLLVLDLHNVESVLAETHSHATEGVVSFASSRFAKDYERLEREWLPLFDLILVTSEDDRARVLKLCSKARVIVFPNALPERPLPEVTEFPRIVFSGNLEYHPNIVGVQWFCQKIWPHVRAKAPKVELWLVGRNPHAVASIIAGDKSIYTTDAVEDTFPLIAQAQVCIAPILSGSGTRFKILEAWAARRAVVSTVLGAEGLGAKHGEQILLAERAETFAVSILNCLESPAVRMRLGEKGYVLYNERYSWPAAWKSLESAGI